MTQSLIQAYRQAPWRNQLNWIATFLLGVIVVALVAGGAMTWLWYAYDDPRAFSEPGPAGMAALSHATFTRIQASRPDAFMYPTANFGSPDIASRWDHHRILDDAGLLRMALVDPGSVNLGRWRDGVPALRCIFKYDFISRA